MMWFIFQLVTWNIFITLMVCWLISIFLVRRITRHFETEVSEIKKQYEKEKSEKYPHKSSVVTDDADSSTTDNRYRVPDENEVLIYMKYGDDIDYKVFNILDFITQNITADNQIFSKNIELFNNLVVALRKTTDEACSNNKNASRINILVDVPAFLSDNDRSIDYIYHEVEDSKILITFYEMANGRPLANYFRMNAIVTHNKEKY